MRNLRFVLPLLLFPVLFFTACENNTGTGAEYLFSSVDYLITTYPSSETTFVVDSSKRRILMIDLLKGGVVDLVKGDGISGIPFYEDFNFVDAAAVPGRMLALYSDGETSVVLLYKLDRIPADGEPYYSIHPVGSDAQKVFTTGSRWGILYPDHIDFYSLSLTMVERADTGVSAFWKRVKVNGKFLILIPSFRKEVYVFDPENSSSRVFHLNFLPSDAFIMGGDLYVIGGGKVARFDMDGEMIGEREMEILWEYAHSSTGNVLGVYDGEYFALLSGKGGLFFMKPDLCFISRYSPGVKEKFFVDRGNPSNPTLEITDFSSCVGDVPDDSFTLIYGDIVIRDNYVESVTSDNCFTLRKEIDGERLKRGDLVFLKGNEVNEFRLRWWSKDTLCVEEKVPEGVRDDSVTVRMDGYALYSLKRGYIGRMGKNDEFDLGYMKLKVHEGDRPVTVDDYFVFSISSGIRGIYLYDISGNFYNYSFAAGEYQYVSALPAGFYIYGDLAEILYSSEHLVGIFSISSGKIVEEIQ